MSKSETPKTDIPGTNNASPFSSFDPMAAWAASQQAYVKMMSDAYGRSQAFADEYAALESQMIARAHSMIDSCAQLARDTVAYSAELSARARKQALEIAHKMSGMA